MSQIQFIPGPIDRLTQGILAGTRLAAMRSEIDTRKLQNQLLEDELANIERTRLGEEQLEAAQIARLNADASFTTAREDVARSLQPLLQRQAEAETTEREAFAETAEKRAGLPGKREAREATSAKTRQTGAVQQQITALMQSLRPVDENFIPQEASDLLEINLPRLEEILGKPVKVGDTTFQYAASELLNTTRRMNEELRLEEKKFEALGNFRLEQLDISRQRADTAALGEGKRQPQLTPTQKELLKPLQNEIERLQKAKSDVFFGLDTSFADTETQKKVKSAKADFDKEIIKVVEKMLKVLREDGNLERPRIGSIEIGEDGREYRFKGGDPSDPNSWEIVK